jgi:hypothetical protein
MSQTVLITLTTAGPNTGPFDVYAEDSIGNTTLIANNVPKASLLSGYTAVVPDNTFSVIVTSDNQFCTNSVELILPLTTTTTTTLPPTTTTTTTSTTSTTTSTSTTTTTTIAPEEFIIKATDIETFSFSYFETSVDVQIDFGPTTVTYLAGTYEWTGVPITNDYLTPYTGDIVIRSTDLSGIIRMEIIANDSNDYILPLSIGTAIAPSGFTAYIEGSELAKLDGLNRLSLLNTAVSISGATTSQFASTLDFINILYADVSGNISALPPTGTTVSLSNFNTVNGDIAGLPSTYSVVSFAGLNAVSGDIGDISSSVTSFTVLGLNALTGDLAGIPGSFSTTGTSPLLTFNVQGENTIFGDINELPIPNMTIVSITGEDGPAEGNEVSGSINDRIWNTGLLVLQLRGRTTVSGDINAFNACTLLQRLVIRGESSDPFTGTTVTGVLSDLPTTTTLTEINFGGKNTVFGSLADISGYTNLQFLLLDGNTTLGEGNSVTGDIRDIPAATSYISLTGRNTIDAYSSSKTWASTMYQFIHLPLDYTTTNRLPTADIDRLIIDLDVPTWSLYFGTSGIIVSAGDRTLTPSASLTAYNNLTAELAALTPPGNITIY